MLRNRYQEVLVGLNLVSLMRGILSRKRNRSTLLIDDPRFKSMSYPYQYLSELELLALSRIGTNHDIPELVDLKEFISPAAIELVAGPVRLKLGNRPLQNIRELIRKFPELMDESDLDLLYSENDGDFEKYFFEELRRYEGLCYESSFRTKGFRFDLQGPKWIKTIYSRFFELLNLPYVESQDLRYQSLLHLLGVLSEEKLKTRMGQDEVPFYFFRMLSPIYRLQDLFITTQLKRRLSIAGGDYKESSIQFWQLHNSRFENLLLESFEGVISADRVLFFSHLPVEVPFKVNSPYAVYRKAQILPQKRPATPFPPAELTLMTSEEGLGSELPYEVLASYPETAASYHWPYPEQPASKASFYEKASWQSFEQDSKKIPFQMKDPVFGGIQSVTLDMRMLQNVRRGEASILSRLPLDIVSEEKVVQGFEYWGSFRYLSHGLLALCYGIEGV